CGTSALVATCSRGWTMNRLLRCTLLPLSAMLIAPVFAADDKKDDPKTPPKVEVKKDADPKTPPKVDVKKDADPKAPPKVAVKKDDLKKPVPKVPERKEAEHKFIRAAEFVGEVVHVEPTKNSIRVKVTISYSEPNKGA